MPCNSDHLEPSQTEQEFSKVMCLLDELDGKKVDRSAWRGFHPKVYNMRRWDLSTQTELLCTRLQHVDVKEYSLEMQMWWRDHQEADRKRIDREIKAIEEGLQREAAIAKLTPYERKLLGL